MEAPSERPGRNGEPVEIGHSTAHPFDKSTRVNFRVADQPLRTVLKQLEAASGIRIDFEPEYPLPAEASQLSFQFDETPFWEALGVINDAADLRVSRISPEGIRLIIAPTKDPPVSRAAAPTTEGPFYVTAVMENGVTGRVTTLRVRAEPRAAVPAASRYSLRFRLADGTTQTFQSVDEPAMRAPVFRPPGILAFPVETSRLAGRIGHSMEPPVPEELTLRTELAVPIAWERMVLPALAEMAPERIAVGGGDLWIATLRRVSGRAGPTRYQATLRAPGVAFDTNTGRRPQSGRPSPVILEQSDGREVTPFSWFRQEELVQAHFKADSFENQQDFAASRLKLMLAGGATERVGPLATIRREPVPAGQAQISVQKFDPEEGTVDLHVSGFSLPDGVLEFRSNGQVLTPESQQVTGASISVKLPTGRGHGDLEQWKPVVRVPVETESWTLHATLQELHPKLFR